MKEIDEEKELCILPKCFEMRAGGEDYFSRCLLMTLGMCCFPQWEKLIPCLELGGAIPSNRAVSGFGHGSQRSPNYYHSPCVVLGKWILSQTLVPSVMLPQLVFSSVPPVKHRPIMFAAGVGFPKGGAVPLFGKVASAAPKGQDRPTPQPHPQDLNPILQRPEHMPASTRTPVCNKCKNVIR